MVRGFLAILAAVAIFASGDVLGAHAMSDKNGMDNMKIADGEATNNDDKVRWPCVQKPGTAIVKRNVMLATQVLTDGELL